MYREYILPNPPKFSCLSPKPLLIALDEQITNHITFLKDFYQFILSSALCGDLSQCSLPCVINTSNIFIIIAVNTEHLLLTGTLLKQFRCIISSSHTYAHTHTNFKDVKVTAIKVTCPTPLSV